MVHIFSSSEHVEETEEQEVQSPLKGAGGVLQDEREREKGGASVGRKLDMETRDPPPQRKRKSKGLGQPLQTPDLNVPLDGTNSIVPFGLVNSRVSQIDEGSESSGGSMLEQLKKQKKGTNVQNARSAAAASDSPRRAQ